MHGVFPVLYLRILPLLLLISSCSLHQDTPIPPLPQAQGTYSQVEAGGTGYQDPGEWWFHFKDPRLDEWMKKALGHNPNILAAQARVEQRLAYSDKSWSSLFPNFNLSAGQSQTKVGSGSSQVQSESFSAALESSYDLDLFGANSSALKASEYDLLGAVEDYRVTLASVSSQLARVWFLHLETLGQIQLAQDSLAANQVNYNWIEQSYRQGQAQAADVLAAKEQMLSSKLLILNLQSLADQQAHQLHQVAGEYPQRLESEGGLPETMELPLIQTGLPSELLQHRPEIKKAILALKAQDHRIAAAVAARFPRLSISAQVGYSAEESTGLSDPGNFLSNFVANLALPIVDMGSRRAEVRRQEQILKERLADYQRVLLSAFVEVENALNKNRIIKQRLEVLAEQVTLSQERLKLTKSGFVQGVNRWDQVLTAQQQYDNYRKSKLKEQRSWVESRIDLFTALGGNWTKSYWEKTHPDLKSQIEEDP